VKVLTERSDEVCRRFLMEAQSMARLNHPNIVAVYDVGVDQNLSYIILEYVHGKTLRETDLKQLPLDKAIAMALQVLEALQYAHAQGIIHRDIKPGNLMLSDENVIKVMDFGLARRMSDISNLTLSGEIVGTIAYLPPERFLGKSGDRASDLYSVGVLLYELACGILPFSSDSGDLVSVMYAHVNDRPKSLRSLNPSIPASLERIIMRLLDKNPAQRYPDAASVIVDLKAVQLLLTRVPQKLTIAEPSVNASQSEPAIVKEAEPTGQEQPGTTASEDTIKVAGAPFAGSAQAENSASTSFTAALGHIMQGMMSAKKQQWREAEDHYAAAIATLDPAKHPSELARTYARLGSMYCAKMKSTSSALPSELATAREYLHKALPVLREKKLNADVREAEANLRSLESSRSA